MASLHYRHTLVTKVFASWKQWLHGCQEARSMEQMRQQQHHKMAALLSRVTSVCQHDPSTLEKEHQRDPSTVENECQRDPSTLEKERQHDPSTLEKECQHDPSTREERQHDPSTECQHNLTIEKECHVTKASSVDKECNSKGHTIVRKKRQPLCNHNPTIVRKQDATIGLITSKLVRQELVSVIVIDSAIILLQLRQAIQTIH